MTGWVPIPEATPQASHGGTYRLLASHNCVSTGIKSGTLLGGHGPRTEGACGGYGALRLRGGVAGEKERTRQAEASWAEYSDACGGHALFCTGGVKRCARVPVVPNEKQRSR